jgi:hypothetical protein
MLTSYKVRENQETQDFFAKVSEVWPSAKVNLHSPDAQDESRCFISLAEGLLLYKGWRGWNFSVVFPDHLVGMHQRFSNQLKEACPPPNKMNVPKAKAIQNWIDYRVKCIAWLEAKLAEVTTVYEAKKAIVEYLLEMYKKSGRVTDFDINTDKNGHFHFDTLLGRLSIDVQINRFTREIYFSKKFYLSLWDNNIIPTLKSLYDGESIQTEA